MSEKLDEAGYKEFMASGNAFRRVAKGVVCPIHGEREYEAGTQCDYKGLARDGDFWECPEILRVKRGGYRPRRRRGTR